MQVTALFITAFLVGLSGAMMPGPLLTLTIAESARRGFIAGPLIILGHAILELLLIFVLLGGLSEYFHRADVTNIIALVGGSFLIYLGITMVRDTLAGNVTLDKLDKAEVKQIRFHPIIAGALVSLSNPYWSLWWATIGLSYLTLALRSGIPGIASFFSGHIMADLAWYSLVALAISAGQRFISQRIYAAILVFCGLFLLGLGTYFIYGVFA